MDCLWELISNDEVSSVVFAGLQPPSTSSIDLPEPHSYWSYIDPNLEQSSQGWKYHHQNLKKIGMVKENTLDCVWNL
jgi:hypothetical protein